MDNKGKKKKGDKYERRVAKAIGHWWQGDKDSFYRSAGSGSRAHHTTIHPGDIVPAKQLDYTFPFCVECKNREGWQLEQLLKNDRPEILQWISKLSEEDVNENLLYILIFTRNFFPDYIVLPDWLSEVKTVKPLPMKFLLFFGDKHPLLITKLDWFFESVLPQNINDCVQKPAVFKRMKEIEHSITISVQSHLL